jgi:hypothetical protein
MYARFYTGQDKAMSDFLRRSLPVVQLVGRSFITAMVAMLTIVNNIALLAHCLSLIVLEAKRAFICDVCFFHKINSENCDL